MKRVAPVRPPAAGAKGAAGGPASAASPSRLASGLKARDASAAASFFSSSVTPGRETSGAGGGTFSRQKHVDGDDDTCRGFLSGQVRTIFDSYNSFLEYEADPSPSSGLFGATDASDNVEQDPFLSLREGLLQGTPVNSSVALLRDFLTFKRHPLMDFHPRPREAVKTKPRGPVFTEEHFLANLASFATATDEDAKPTSVILEIASYTSIVEAQREHPFLLALMQAPPAGIDVTISIDNWRQTCACSVEGELLKGTLPPLPSGRHILMFCTRSGYPIPLLLSPLLRGKKDADPTKPLTPVLSIPLMVVRAPQRRQDPSLCYSTLKSRKERPPSAATGPYTAADLEELVAAFSEVKGVAQFIVPRAQGVGPVVDRTGRLISQAKGQDFRVRLADCLNTAAKGKNSPLFGAAETVMIESAHNCDVRIPLPFKASLFNSCAATSRLSIACFHSRIFEFEPYGVLSAQVFTKSRYSDVYTIFSFSLTPKEAGPQASVAYKSQIQTPYIPGLDRFEATERLCADTRFWSYVDGCVPLKNRVAAAFEIDNFATVECPVPQMLRHARNPYRAYPDGLQVAPGVYLFFEAWPNEVLRMPPNFAEESLAPAAAVEAVSEAAKAVRGEKSRGDAGGDAPKKDAAPPPKEEPARGDCRRNGARFGAVRQRGRPPQFFSVTLCVGQHIFSSVMGVEADVVEFIINRWLAFVPNKDAIPDVRNRLPC
ncbi:hypothetical protein BESB_007870 [Besnoitia besnoiti]|uniref:Uncharacterized protein n=1 Tax=Besnoitia besnoiti TaxID=94643 RepID=A0A2A9MKD5_BESBE|nr:hypothetical protein BESB_007870 [Besnoitia besnoiti]PFH38445.1 hypothetical protein BESB_007870 [Besnoitia besnoiti]